MQRWFPFVQCRVLPRRRWVVLALSSGVVFGFWPSRALAMEDCHLDASTIPAPSRPPSSRPRSPRADLRWQLRLSPVAATYRNSRYEGHYEGASLGLEAWGPRVAFGLTAPFYRITRNGQEVMGLGDLTLSSRLTFFESPRETGLTTSLRFGAHLGVSVPTGEVRSDLGMGHVMAMPGFWLGLAEGPMQLTLQAGYGVALGTEGHTHNSTGPIVQPMNMSEGSVGAALGVRVAPSLELSGGGMFAGPLGTAVGAARGTAYIGALLRVSERIELGAELHAPWLGDPYAVKGRLHLIARF